MLVKFEKEVNCCLECPYYKEEQDMSAVHSMCIKKEDLGYYGYGLILDDVNYHNANKKISKQCPLK